MGEGELPWHPSFFEMLTAIAFEHFARRKVEIAVLEVGMGGRLDATNVVEPRVSVITDISLDHQKFLGDTVTEIAGEKAGIIRPGGVVVTLPQQPQANDVIGNTILELGARAVNAVPYVPPVSPASSEYRAANAACTPVSRYPLQVMGEQITVETPLLGRHQLRNVALAIAAAEELGRQGFPISATSIESGIRETHWAGTVPGHARHRERARICVRCCPQPGRSVGAAFHSFSRLSGSRRLHLFSARCGTRRSERWRKFCFPWRTG